MEVVVTSENSGQLWNCCIWDPLSGTSLRSFKGGISCSRTLTTIASDYLISAQKDKPILQVWAMNRQDQSTTKMVVPAVVQALAISPCGSYCVAGAAEQLLVWAVSTGKMLASLRRHYQNVNSVVFTCDGSGFISIGAEGLVLVWNMESVLGSSSDAEPEFSWSDHSLPVTAVCITKSIVQPLVFSVSLDQTCKVHDFHTGRTLLSIQLHEPLHSVAVDNAEETCFMGSASGKIYSVNLLDPPRDIQYVPDTSFVKFVGHDKAVTCLSVSIDGSLLLSGCDDASSRVWDVNSGQCIRILTHRGPLTNAFFCPKFKHFEAEKLQPRVTVAQFQKKREAECNLQSEILIQETLFDCKSRSNGPSSNSNREDILQSDVARLTRINKDLYNFAVEHVLKKPT